MLKVDGETAERPQHVFMRTALALHREDIDLVLESYEQMSTNSIIHSQQTLHSSGTTEVTRISSTSINIPSDDTEDTYDAMKESALAIQGGSDVSISLQSIPSAG